MPSKRPSGRLGVSFLILVLLVAGGASESPGELIRLQPDGSLVITGSPRPTAPPLLLSVGARQLAPIRLLQPLRARSESIRAVPSWSARFGPTGCTAPETAPAVPELAELIRKYAGQYGLDPKLVHLVIRMESGYNPHAVSPKGALGLMQLMPGTAALLGVRDPFDVEQNLAGGIRYLKMCLERFNNQLPLALAAYNAGPENVCRYGGVPPFAETLNYVRQILAAYTGEPSNFPVAAGIPPQPTTPPQVQDKHLPLPFYLGSRARLTVTLAGGAKVIQIQRF